MRTTTNHINGPPQKNFAPKGFFVTGCIFVIAFLPYFLFFSNLDVENNPPKWMLNEADRQQFLFGERFDRIIDGSYFKDPDNLRNKRD